MRNSKPGDLAQAKHRCRPRRTLLSLLFGFLKKRNRKKSSGAPLLGTTIPFDRGPPFRRYLRKTPDPRSFVNEPAARVYKFTT